jgi:hypothetical protein
MRCHWHTSECRAMELCYIYHKFAVVSTACGRGEYGDGSVKHGDILPIVKKDYNDCQKVVLRLP